MKKAKRSFLSLTAIAAGALFATTTTSHASAAAPPPVTGTIAVPANFAQDAANQCFSPQARDNANNPYPFSRRQDRAARFLLQATFGPTMGEVNTLQASDFCSWLTQQYQMPASEVFQIVNGRPQIIASQPLPAGSLAGNTDDIFWYMAGASPDQLRQRVAYALSQIIVVSDRNTDLRNYPAAMGHYIDILGKNALGNYFDMLEAITYSPAMAVYLTYLNNEKGNGTRVPDENYAREILQLFSIGTVELNRNGTPKLQNGETIQTYDNQDIQELARVFTGLRLSGMGFGAPLSDIARPAEVQSRLALTFDNSRRDQGSKTVLGQTISSALSGPQSIDRVLDILADHPNTAPFISRQLIQRLVTSNPSPDYVDYVSRVFNEGRYLMPNGQWVGANRTGDLMATVAAVLLYPEASRISPQALRVTVPETPQTYQLTTVSASSLQPMDTFGKYREPAIRLVNLARSFGATEFRRTVSGQSFPFSAFGNANFAQDPHSSPSVFNFYRPGFIPSADTELGARGVTAPERQILNETTVFGISNFIEYFILQFPCDNDPGRDAYCLDYERPGFSLINIAHNRNQLILRISLLLNGRTLDHDTITRFRNILGPDNANMTYDARVQRTRLALYLFANAIETTYSR